MGTRGSAICSCSILCVSHMFRLAAHLHPFVKARLVADCLNLRIRKRCKSSSKACFIFSASIMWFMWEACSINDVVWFQSKSSLGKVCILNQPSIIFHILAGESAAVCCFLWDLGSRTVEERCSKLFSSWSRTSGHSSLSHKGCYSRQLASRQIAWLKTHWLWHTGWTKIHKMITESSIVLVNPLW